MNKLKDWFTIEKSIFSSWKMIFDISKKEFKKEFAGSKLGMAWAIIRPLSMIAIFWVIFSSGLRDISGDIKVPYLVWLVAAYVPWIFISDAMVAGASAIRVNSFLVKKVKFPVEILPNIRILISFYTFLILLAINFIIFATNGTLHLINFPKLIYAILITIIFLCALTRLLASWVVMSIDILHGITVSMQFLFWMCPIMWAQGEIAPNYPWIQQLLKLNPFYYLALLFRDAFLGTQTASLQYGLYFIVWIIVLYIIGSKVFNKFRPEFDDVL
ncbi:ABC transporter permease [Clostridium tarantellae]|uniref:ABC transporter permease n=1 Tax=Clostridium tarantellae TaxID=39493 RepID=UPI002E16631C|nr:ABC transporter permease [Clostridium tarantellae]